MLRGPRPTTTSSGWPRPNRPMVYPKAGSSGSSPAQTYCTAQPVVADQLRGRASSWSSQATVCGSCAGRRHARERRPAADDPTPEPDRRCGRRADLWTTPAAVPHSYHGVGAAGGGRALAALALVHRGHPGDRDGVPLGDQVGGQLLRLGQRARPTGRRRRTGRGAVVTVNSPGRTPAASSQATGADTGRPGRIRGL